MRFNILLLMFFLVVGTGFWVGGYVWGYLIGSLITLPFAFGTAVFKMLGNFKGMTIKRVYAFWGATLTTAHFTINAKIGLAVGVPMFTVVMGCLALLTAFWALKHAREMTTLTDNTLTRL